uniref:Uncharacterized protein n=1 Tax=uncultured delta proteobacterium HF0130_19C20 TaxID=710828 RepID=E0XT50_9DELT|nr:hypothetical protein [uncultured delta proteobacterium HF0130_19C20]
MQAFYSLKWGIITTFSIKVKYIYNFPRRIIYLFVFYYYQIS